MAEGVEIARATREDIDSVHRIEVESFPEPWRRDFFVGELHAERRLNLVARRNGEVIGYLFSMWIFDEMHVNKIAVTSSERRRGIAELLMTHCFGFAIDNSITSISLEVRRSNLGAQEFYRHLDFSSAYLRPRYYPDGEAAVVMVRTM